MRFPALLLLLAAWAGPASALSVVVGRVGGGPAEVPVGDTITFEVRLVGEPACCATFSLDVSGIPGFADLTRADSTGTSFDSADVSFAEGLSRLNFVASETLGAVDDGKLGEFDLLGTSLGSVSFTLRPGFEFLDGNEETLPVTAASPLMSVQVVVPEPQTLGLLATSLAVLAAIRRPAA